LNKTLADALIANNQVIWPETAGCPEQTFNFNRRKTKTSRSTQRVTRLQLLKIPSIRSENQPRLFEKTKDSIQNSGRQKTKLINGSRQSTTKPNSKQAEL